MSEFIDREKAIANIKAAYCCGCDHYPEYRDIKPVRTEACKNGGARWTYGRC